MSESLKRIARALIWLAAASCVPAAHAQLGDLIRKGTGHESAGESAGLGGLGAGLSAGSLNSGSIGNVAGLLEFCIRNNYLGSDAAASVKNGLMSKLPGGAPASDPGYRSGARGILTSSDGKRFDLSGGGLKEQVTRQVCDRILSQGKSLL
jgi:hypothetical protein